MKKVPILSNLEQGLDKTIKDLMGPLKMFYPWLKATAILADPATLIAYVGYRSIPYLVDALKSRAAIDSYKKIGKSVGKGLGKANNMALKYSKKSVLSLGAIATKQLSRLKEYSLEKSNEREMRKGNELDSSLEELHYDNCINLDVNDNFEVENGFSFMDNSIEQDFFTEPQISESEIDYELNDDEIDLDCLNVSDDFSYRFTIDSNSNIKQYSVYKHNICETPKSISQKDYRNICNKYIEFERNKEKTNVIEKDNDLEI